MTDRKTMELRLYVAGNAPNSVQARRNLNALLAQCEPDSYQLEVIDCLIDPLRTLEDGIIVTPTLLRVEPKPEARVIGTLGDQDNLRAAMGLNE
jgi:circadian clock protein KaiB